MRVDHRDDIPATGTEQPICDMATRSGVEDNRPAGAPDQPKVRCKSIDLVGSRNADAAGNDFEWQSLARGMQRSRNEELRGVGLVKLTRNEKVNSVFLSGGEFSMELVASNRI